MKLVEWQEKFIQEDAVGTGAQTTSANVAYIPSDVPPVHDELTKLSRKKNKWNIDILESPYDYTVNFENYSSIVVPAPLWENFKTTIFGTSNLPDGEFIVDLSGYLLEALSDEVQRSLQQLRNATIQLLNSDIIASQRHKVASLEKMVGEHLDLGTEGQSVITGTNVEQQLSQFLQLIQNTYKNDVGSIQLVATAIQQRSPLTEIPLFNQYDNLISVVLSSGSFTYQSAISLDFIVDESLDFVGRVPKGLSSTLFKTVGKVVYPTNPKGFPSNITDYLKGA